MKKILTSFLATLSIALILVFPASAENNNMNTTNMNTNDMNTNSYRANATTDDNGTDWGWLGLLGLVGLLGLRSRNPERH